MAEDDSFSSGAGRVLLQHLEMNLRLLENAIASDYQSDRQSLLIVPTHFMFFDVRFGSAATVLGGLGRAEVPFHIGCARYKRDVMEVDDL